MNLLLCMFVKEGQIKHSLQQSIRVVWKKKKNSGSTSPHVYWLLIFCFKFHAGITRRVCYLQNITRTG